MLTSSPVYKVVARIAERMLPWPEIEAELAEVAPVPRVYLGGDGLRPYAAWTDDERVRLVGVLPPDIPPPPLFREVLSGRHGPPVVEKDPADPRAVGVSLHRSDWLMRRLEVPNVLLIGLGDTDRYRGARLPLGVARLGQWLRFAHAALVTVIDYNFVDTPLESVTEQLSRHSIDVLGISVNFGQWHMLEDLAILANKYRPPVVMLGNILAAFSPEQAAALFNASRDGAVLVATGLGERPMEQLCRDHRNPAAWDEIAGVVRPGCNSTRRPSRIDRHIGPPELVFPDDSLMLAVAERNGQLSLETSFGCQYGACTFCPRDHRGDGWARGQGTVVEAVLKRAAPTGAVLSLVDEEFFGAEGLVDPPPADLPAATILAACRKLGISYELYTRLEQIFDRRRSVGWNLGRARLLATEAPTMRRMFVGVESGSPSQLRRYGKGQTVAQTVDALRIGSTLGVPMEFGFITFDPLLTPENLAENIEFLGRRDIILKAANGSIDDRVAKVAAYLEVAELGPARTPLYQHVAYMATELEVLAHSRYADHLRRRHPDLLDGSFDAGFARHGVRYRDERISDVAGWCRVWTEGMFVPVYEARMAARAAGDPARARAAHELVARYREATFTLITSLTCQLVPEVAGRLDGLLSGTSRLTGPDPEQWLEELASMTLQDGKAVAFDLRLLGLRRDR